MTKELNQLVGLQKVKEEALKVSYISKGSVRKEKESGLKVPKRTFHIWSFMGNPGNWKDDSDQNCRVGCIISCRPSSKGHFTEVSRTDLIVGYQGQTALKVKMSLKKQKVVFLFIDEAYRRYYRK